ncbi:MAG TPA: hypothetical protein VME01_09975, partial [Solirubrobacteraceae bacterium]|nr:hypothetical protein [Solirubrobacteraceae bacterium]
FKALATVNTDNTGGYSFTQTPIHNTVYQVRTGSGATAVHTADLYVGVQDMVTLNASATSVSVGDAVTLSGTVTPDHTGHVFYVQRLNANGNWVDVESGYLTSGSRYSLSYWFGQPGPIQLRVQVPGGPWDVGGVSTAVSITGTSAAPASTLPPAS